MRDLRRAAIALTALLLVSGVGVAVPRLMSDGVSDLPMWQQSLGEEALRASATCIDNPIQRLYTLRLRVASIIADAACTEPAIPTFPLNGYRAIISQHSYFGLPLAMITVCAPTTICG